MIIKGLYSVYHQLYHNFTAIYRTFFVAVL